MTKQQRIIDKALEIINSSPDGIRYSDLGARLEQELLDIAPNYIFTVFWNLDSQFPEKVYKPSRGLFKSRIFENTESTSPEEQTVVEITEEAFYKPFAEWLVKVSQECTKAISLGGNRFRDKWGTPDVIGKWKARESDIIKIPTEIVTAEVKADTYQIITAFGQACAYKLFSHKAYIVVPNDSVKEDIDRLESLCPIFGIGLVLFNRNEPANPNFDLRIRPIKQDPDMFYVNRFMKIIERELFD